MLDAAARARMSRSSEDFLSLVWPQIGDGFGQLIPVETVTDNAFASELDRRAGIDTWVICVDGHMRGLASRVQWTDDPYDTFTIRVRARNGGPTEYHKRRAELATDGAVRPHYICQGYINYARESLLSAAVARMADVIRAVDDRLGWAMPVNSDGTQGYAVKWSALESTGVPMRIWRRQICPPGIQGVLL